jgi:hypothetical protein
LPVGAHEATDEGVSPQFEQQPPDLGLKDDDDRQDEDLVEVAEERAQDRQIRKLHQELHQKQRSEPERDLNGDGAPHQPVEPVEQVRHQPDVDDVAHPEADNLIEGHGTEGPCGKRRCGAREKGTP